MFYNKLTTLASLLLESASALETSPLMDYQQRAIFKMWLQLLYSICRWGYAPFVCYGGELGFCYEYLIKLTLICQLQCPIWGQEHRSLSCGHGFNTNPLLTSSLLGSNLQKTLYPNNQYARNLFVSNTNISRVFKWASLKFWKINLSIWQVLACYS